MSTATATRVQSATPDLFATELTAGVSEAPVGGLQALAGRVSPSSERLRERACQSGIDTLSEAEVLEVYLARTSPRGAATYAAALMARFGSFHAILAADVSALSCIIDHDTAMDLKLLYDVSRRSLEIPVRERELLSSWSAVTAYLKFTMASRPRELVRVLYLDKRNRLIADEQAGEGSVDHAPVYPREIARRALEHSACSLILAHNHPSESPDPSRGDIDITKQVVDCLKVFGITVHDHIIVAGAKTTSMRALGLL